MSRLQDADADVTAEVFRSVHRGISRFQRGATGGTFRGWLRTITRHTICDMGRLKAREVQGTGGSDAQAELLAVPEMFLPDQDEQRD